MIGETPKYLINIAIIIGKIKVYLFIFADLAILYTEINIRAAIAGFIPLKIATTIGWFPIANKILT